MLWFEKEHNYNTIQTDLINVIIEKYNLDPFIAGLIAKRNDFDIDKIDYFLSDTFKPVSPMAMKDMSKAVEKIIYHMNQNHKIRTESDFDCDGLFSIYILVQTFKTLGYQHFDYHIPHREKDGYGLSVKAVEQAYQNGVKLIITVDNGISAIEPVARANELGIDVVQIIIHHLKHYLMLLQ